MKTLSYKNIKPTKGLNPKVVPELAKELRDRNYCIVSHFIGNSSPSTSLSEPSWKGSVMIPYVMLESSLMDESDTDPVRLQMYMPGKRLTSMVSQVRLNEGDCLQTQAWLAANRKRWKYQNLGVNAMYTISSLPVDCVTSGDKGKMCKDLPTSIGKFLGNCRNQLGLKDIPGIHVDWRMGISSHTIPAWEGVGIRLTPPPAAFSAMVLPAIGEYLSALLTAPTILTNIAKQNDRHLLQEILAGTVLANLKAFEKMLSRQADKLGGYDTMPNLTEFKVRMEFAERFVTAAQREVYSRWKMGEIPEPDRFACLKVEELDLVKAYRDIVEDYGTKYPYSSDSRGNLPEGVERHQADAWKLNLNMLRGRVTRIRTTKKYDHFFPLLDEVTFATASDRAFERSYPETYCTEVVDRLKLSRWKDNLAEVVDLGHSTWWDLMNRFDDKV